MGKFNHRNAGLRICIDARDGGSLAGKVFSQRLLRPMSFSDLGNLIVQIEKLLDAQNFPQAFQRIRSFGGAGGWPELAAADPDLGMSADEVQNARGSIATVTVTVTTRRNASWQGEISWLDGAEREEFSSALELVRLIDERIFV